MADVEFGEFAADDPYGSGRGAGFQRLINGAGALTSLALVIGLGVWGYRLAVRDVTGIPVIRALEGPARVAPDAPGGELAAHQGLAVNAIAAEGEAAPPPGELRLAPAPADLGPQAVPMGELAAGMDGPVAAPLSGDPLAADEPAAPDPDAVPVAAAEAAPAVVIPASVPGVARSLRPPMRPEARHDRPAQLHTASYVPDAPDGDAMAEAAAAAVAEALAGRGSAREVVPESLPEGARLVQLGAFDTPETARAEWDRIAERFGALMEGKDRVVQKAESGGNTFYRLRVAGFADLADARSFCEALLAEGANCVPAQVR